MSGIPPIIVDRVPQWRKCRSSDIQSAFSGDSLNIRSDELYHDDNKHESAGNDDAQDPTICLGSIYNGVTTDTIATSICGINHDVINGSKL